MRETELTIRAFVLVAAHSVGTFQETGDRGSYGADRTGDLVGRLLWMVCVDRGTRLRMAVIHGFLRMYGCCVRGTELFGIRLPENFNTPLYSTSLSEYWRRWHITLGAWVKDYVMYPILKTKGLQTRAKKWKKKYGKKMGKKMTTWIGLFFTWLVVGLWHGGAWTFVFWIRSVFLSYDRWWAGFRADW